MIKVFYIVFIFLIVIVQNRNYYNIIEDRSTDSEFECAMLNAGVDCQFLLQADLEDVEEDKLKPDSFDFLFLTTYHIAGAIKRMCVPSIDYDNFHLHFSDSSPPIAA